MEDEEIKANPSAYLIECVRSKRTADWDSWRVKNNSDVVIVGKLELSELDFQNANCEKVQFVGTKISNCIFNNIRGDKIKFHDVDIAECSFMRSRIVDSQFTECQIKNTTFHGAQLGGASFLNTTLTNSNLSVAWLSKSEYNGATIVNCNFQAAKLHGADFSHAKYISKCDFQDCKMNENMTVGHMGGSFHYEPARFISTIIDECNFIRAKLSGVVFDNSEIIKSNFTRALVNGETSFWGIEVDNVSNFDGVGLSGVRIESGVYDRVMYHLRKKSWENWYRQGNGFIQFIKRVTVQPFWFITNYGDSTFRIIASFFAISFLFSLVYFSSAFFSPPGVVNGLLDDTIHEAINKSNYFPIFIRSFYFSIVTMTTLGFGDMFAVRGSILSHILLIFQVLIGYVLLGALITRLGMLFTSKGPN